MFVGQLVSPSPGKKPARTNHFQNCFQVSLWIVFLPHCLFPSLCVFETMLDKTKYRENTCLRTDCPWGQDVPCNILWCFFTAFATECSYIDWLLLGERFMICSLGFFFPAHWKMEACLSRSNFWSFSELPIYLGDTEGMKSWAETIHVLIDLHPHF